MVADMIARFAMTRLLCRRAPPDNREPLARSHPVRVVASLHAVPRLPRYCTLMSGNSFEPRVMSPYWSGRSAKVSSPKADKKLSVVE